MSFVNGKSFGNCQLHDAYADRSFAGEKFMNFETLLDRSTREEQIIFFVKSWTVSELSAGFR